MTSLFSVIFCDVIFTLKISKWTLANFVFNRSNHVRKFLLPTFTTKCPRKLKFLESRLIDSCVFFFWHYTVFVLDRPFPLSRRARTLWAWHLTRQSTSGTLQERIRGARGAIPGKVHDLLISLTRSLECLTRDRKRCAGIIPRSHGLYPCLVAGR